MSAFLPSMEGSRLGPVGRQRLDKSCMEVEVHDAWVSWVSWVGWVVMDEFIILKH